MHLRRVLLSTVPWASCGCRCSVTESCPTLGDPVDCSTPGFPVLHYLPESVMLSNRLILCHPLLLLPSIFPSIRVFSNELAHWSNRWLKSWSFSFSIHSSVDSALTSFTIDWFDLLKVQGTLKGFVQHHDFYSHWQTKQRAKLSNDGENKVGGTGSWSIKLLKLPTLFIAATVGTVWLPHDPGRNQAPFES